VLDAEIGAGRSTSADGHRDSPPRILLRLLTRPHTEPCPPTSKLLNLRTSPPPGVIGTGTSFASGSATRSTALSVGVGVNAAPSSFSGSSTGADKRAFSSKEADCGRRALRRLADAAEERGEPAPREPVAVADDTYPAVRARGAAGVRGCHGTRSTRGCGVRVWAGAGPEERGRAAHDRVGLGLSNRVAVVH
jgi:hypothetical protein